MLNTSMDIYISETFYHKSLEVFSLTKKMVVPTILTLFREFWTMLKD